MSLSEHFDDELATGGPLEDDDFLVDRGILLFGTTLLPQTLVLDPRTWILRPPTVHGRGRCRLVADPSGQPLCSCFSVLLSFSEVSVYYFWGWGPRTHGP